MFEKADKKAKFHVPPRLPRPDRPNEWSGIVYLHGRLGNASKASPEDEEFVLSSTDFGRAYLTDGWATAFIRGLMSRFQIVFLGYAADDPPVQYLLEALGRSGAERRGLFAFQAGPVEHARAVWAAKGVEAISYDGQHEHKALWKTLEAWAERARDPERWYQALLAKAQLGPSSLAPHERGQIKHTVLSATGARRFLEAKPPAEWLGVLDASLRYGTPQEATETQERWDPFDEYGLDDDELPSPPDPNNNFNRRSPPKGAWDGFLSTPSDHQVVRTDHLSSVAGHRSIEQPSLLPRLNYLSAWVSQVSSSPITPWWAAGRGNLHPVLADMIRRNLNKGAAPEAVLSAWNILFASNPSGDNNFDLSWFDFEAELKLQGWNESRVLRWAELLKPRISTKKPVHTNTPPTNDFSLLTTADMVSAEVNYPREHESIELPSNLLEMATFETRRLLLIARHIHGMIREGEYFSIPPIVADPEVAEDGFNRDYSISRLFFRYTSLLERLGKYSREALRREVSAWPREWTVFDRLRVWIAGKSDWFSGEEAVQLIRATGDRTFWSSDAQRDLLLTLNGRWPDLSTSDRDRIIGYIAEGPPPHPKEDGTKNSARRAYRALERLEWLKARGLDLGPIYEKVRPTLIASCPDWDDESGSNAAASLEGRSGFIETDDDPSALMSARTEEVLRVAEAEGRRDWKSFTEKRPFSGLAKTRPLKAFRALMLAAKADNYPAWAWDDFFYAPQRASDSVRLKELIATRLCELPPNRVREFIRSIARWLDEAAAALSLNPRKFDCLWLRIISAIEEDPSCCRPSLSRSGRFDWVSLALNSPGGELAQALMKLEGRTSGEQGLSPTWLRKVEELLSVGGDVKRTASAIFLFNINWFFYHEPAWTEKNLLSLLDGDDEDIAAFWSGALWSSSPPQGELFLKLKPMLVELAARDDELGEKNQRLAAFLLLGWAGRRVNGTRFLSNAEMRNALVRSGEDFRSQVLWHLQRWSNETPRVWRKRLYIFLRDIWPQQNSIKTSRTSSRLFDLAIESGNSFPKVAALVVPLMTSVDQDAFMLLKAEHSEKNLIDRFPEAMLDIVFVALGAKTEHWPYGADQVVNHLALKPEVQLDPRLLDLRRRLAAR